MEYYLVSYFAVAVAVAVWIEARFCSSNVEWGHFEFGGDGLGFDRSHGGILAPHDVNYGWLYQAQTHSQLFGRQASRVLYCSTAYHQAPSRLPYFSVVDSQVVLAESRGN